MSRVSNKTIDAAGGTNKIGKTNKKERRKKKKKKTKVDQTSQIGSS